jgi:hypothetical protein
MFNTGGHVREEMGGMVVQHGGDSFSLGEQGILQAYRMTAL